LEYKEIPDILSDKTSDLFYIFEIPSVAICRDTANSIIYYVAGCAPHKDTLFYFIAVFPDKYRNIFEAALRLASDEGIGGRRHTRGWGAFEIIEKNIITPLNEVEVFKNLFKSETTGPWLLISPYIPTNEEIERIDENCYYRVSTYRSFVYPTNTLKPDIRFIQEGSILSFKPEGKEVVVESEEFVIKGSALSVPTNWGCSV